MTQRCMKKAKLKEVYLELSRNQEHMTSTYNSKHWGHYILYPHLQPFAMLPEEWKNVETTPTEDR